MEGLSGPLGSGTYRVFVYDRGGQRRIGEIVSIASLNWHRVRDDISAAGLSTNGFDDRSRSMLRDLRCMRHELVFFRNGVRVWEGPITRLTYNAHSVDIACSDVMQYVYRRLIIGGYNDAYPNTLSVVARAQALAATALARDNPNVSAFITTVTDAGDAKQSRIVKPYQKTSWEEIDDLAAKAGLDYTVIGRRIMFWDTHNAIARLPVMDDNAFLGNVIVTEYGQSMATLSAVTDGNGGFGVAGGYDYYYGYVEILNSSYGESASSDVTVEVGQPEIDRAAAQARLRIAEYSNANYPALSSGEDAQLTAYNTELATATDPMRIDQLHALIGVLQGRKDGKQFWVTEQAAATTAYNARRNAQTPENQAKWDSYLNTLEGQAQRNLNYRNPAPLVVRVPDGSQLSPLAKVGINELIPGSWVPLRADSTCRSISQWQKLDKLDVTFSPDTGEQVALTLMPAPQNGQDPDVVVVTG